MSFGLKLLFLTLIFSGLGFAEEEALKFRADFYERNVARGTLRLQGNAWILKDGQEIWADIIDVDYNTDTAVAVGNIHIKHGSIDMWCERATYKLDGSSAILEQATVTSSQMVLTGLLVKKIGSDTYEVEDGNYTNCNIALERGAHVGTCDFDWKISGRRFSVTTESYLQIHDALIYIKRLPVLYSPYFIAPVKTKRQTGFLLPSLSNQSNLGSGISLPFFWALGEWHDLTLVPNYASRFGLHLGAFYRYEYDSGTRGYFNAFGIRRRFSSNRKDPKPDDTARNRFLGTIGEWAVKAENKIQISERSHTRQLLQLVSDPYYTLDYGSDIDANEGTPYLRSLINYTRPSDSFLLTAEARYHQSLIVSKDQVDKNITQVDRGAVVKLPSISLFKSNTAFWDKYLSYELDTNFSNFTRPGEGYDSIPLGITQADVDNCRLGIGCSKLIDVSPTYHAGNYIRTGRRLQIEPRLVANIPMPEGFQLQPVLRGGTLFYHFDHPSSSFSHREYSDIEIPASIYLSKKFSTGIAGFEQMNHLIQPRIVYGASLYQHNEDHPFFDGDERELRPGSTQSRLTQLGLSNPRFDLLDKAADFEYFRFELINRIRRKTENGVERLLLLEVSNQYNSRTSPHDPRFQNKLGPIEVYGEIRSGNLEIKLQGLYQLEKKNNTHEGDWGFEVAYVNPHNFDRFRLNTTLNIRANPDETARVLYLDFVKQLPIFFDVGAAIEYDFSKGHFFKDGNARAYALSLQFGSKPRSCWSLTTNFGKSAANQFFTSFNFSFNFGKGI